MHSLTYYNVFENDDRFEFSGISPIISPDPYEP